MEMILSGSRIMRVSLEGNRNQDAVHKECLSGRIAYLTGAGMGGPGAVEDSSSQGYNSSGVPSDFQLQSD